MRMIPRLVVLSVHFGLALPGLNGASSSPQSLPDSSNFELTLREDNASTIPLGPSCGDEAARTLACRAFALTLKNVGKRTVRLSRIVCQDPIVLFERAEPSSSDGWWPISRVSTDLCTPWAYENLRLHPGETTVYKTRLISPHRPPDYSLPFAPETYPVRANWTLRGCTEDPEGTDCLTPLQIIEPGSAGVPTSDIEWQRTVEVVSNTINVIVHPLRDLGPLKIGLEISVAPLSEAIEARKHLDAHCATDTGTSMECTVFHYAIRNLGDRPIRNSRWTCSDFSIWPEYRTDKGNWKHLESTFWSCNSNVPIETPIMPGEATEGNITLAALSWALDTSPMYPAGSYEIRFHFQTEACFASPDGTFCIQVPKKQPVVLSKALAITGTTFIPVTNSGADP